jgi:hypothetical protein
LRIQSYFKNHTTSQISFKTYLNFTFQTTP